MAFIDKIIGQLAPHDCVGCGQEGSLLCTKCTAGLAAPPDQQAFEALCQVSAAASYDTVAKDLVWQLKFQGAQAAATIMAERMACLIKPAGQRFIVPVPTATGRVRQRGYDQAKLLARQLARRGRLPYLDCLQRQGQAHQVGASRHRRQSQLQTAFRLKQGYNVHGYQVILVDDVLTTGATLEAAAALLRTVGAARIDAVVFARA